MFVQKGNIIQAEFEKNDHCIQAFNISRKGNSNHFIHKKDWKELLEFLDNKNVYSVIELKKE